MHMATDGSAKMYFGRPDVAADLISHFLFGGKYRVNPSDLTSLDPTIVQEVEDSDSKTEERFNDLLFELTLPSDAVANSERIRPMKEMVNSLFTAIQRQEQQAAPGSSLQSITPAAAAKDRVSPQIMSAFGSALSPYISMFLSDELQRDFSALNYSNQSSDGEAFLMDVENAICKAVRFSSESALKMMQAQFEHCPEKLNIIINFEPMGQTAFDTVFVVLKRVWMMYKVQIRKLREQEYKDAMAAYEQKKAAAEAEYQKKVKNGETAEFTFNEAAPKLHTYMKSGDVIYPVIPIVINLGVSRNWTPSTDVYGVLSGIYPPFLQFTPNSFYNVVSPSGMEGDDFEGFQTDLGLVLHVFKLGTREGSELYTKPEMFKILSEEGRRLLASALDLDELSMGTIKRQFQGGEKMCDSTRAFLDEFNSQKETIAAQEEEIAAQEEEIAAQEEEIAAQKEELAAKDSQLAAKDSEIAVKDSQLAAKDKEQIRNVQAVMKKMNYTATKAMDFLDFTPDEQAHLAPLL